MSLREEAVRGEEGRRRERGEVELRGFRLLYFPALFTAWKDFSCASPSYNEVLEQADELKGRGGRTIQSSTSSPR